jgi:hypothetical protein
MGLGKIAQKIFMQSHSFLLEFVSMGPNVRDALLLAALTTVSVSISSSLAFLDVTRAFLTPSIATIACSFPLGLAVLKPGVLLSDVLKCISGCMIGWVLGACIYAIGSTLASNVATRAVVATILTFPVVFGLVLADPVCKSPLSAFFQPNVAIITMYVMSSFAKDLAYVAGMYMLIAYCAASIVTLLVFFSVRPVVNSGSTASSLRDAMTEFRSALTHWFEGLGAFMQASSDHHGNELNSRQLRATEALASLQSTIKMTHEGGDCLAMFKDTDAARNLSVNAVVIHSQLLALQGTIFSETYSPNTVKTLLNPIRDSLDKLKASTILALRPTTPEDIRSGAIDRICNEALVLYNDFARNISSNLRGETKEEIRLVFAVTSIVRFAMLSHHLLTSSRAATQLLSPWTSFRMYVKNQLKTAFMRSEWRKTTNYRYAFRSALAQQIMTQSLLLLAKSYPTRVSPYLFWALIPVVTNFLATVGAGLTQGSRNVLGCLLGAIMGILTALSNCGNRQAIYLEMLIIAFVCKYLSSCPQWNVAALTFASTWNVLSIPNLHIDELKLLLSLIGYRISLTTLGVVTAAILSVILFPSFAATVLRKSTARAVTTASRLVNEGIVGVATRLPLKATESFDEERSVNSASFSPAITVSVFEGAGSKALQSIKKHTGLIKPACEDSIPELALIDKLGGDSEASSVSSLGSLIASEPLIQNLCDAACVFSSIAAATRVQENIHSAVFTKSFLNCLYRMVDIIEGAAARIAAAVMDPKSDLKIDSKLSIYAQEITNELLHIRESLDQCGLLASADRGGWLQIYVFHFALVEFIAAWDELAIHLERRRRGSEASLKSHILEDSFNSPTRFSLTHRELKEMTLSPQGRGNSFGWR